MRTTHTGTGRRTRALLAAATMLLGCGGDRSKAAPEEGEQGSAEESPPVSDPDLERRLGELEEHAREALRERDISRARRHLEEGIELAEGSDRAFEIARGRLLLCAAAVEREAGREVEARRHLVDAMAVFRVEQDDEGQLEVQLALVRLEAMLGDYAAAGRALDEAEGILSGIEDAGLEGEFLIQAGRLASRRVRYEEARDTFIEAARILLGAGLKAEYAEAMLLLADEEDRIGQTRQAQSSLDKALKVFSGMNDRDGEVRAMHRQAAIAEREGRYRRARALLRKVHALYDALGRTSDAAMVSRHMNALPETDRER